MRVALLLSTSCFEDFYGAGMGLSADDYVRGYRNDWSWDYCALLGEHGIDATIYVASVQRGGAFDTPDGFRVRFLRLGRGYEPWRRLPPLGRTPPGRYVAQAANAAAMRPALAEALRADRVDVLCIQEHWTGRFDLLARTSPVPVVAIDQGYPDRRDLKLFKRGAFRRTREVIVQTYAEAAKVRRFGGSPVRVPNAVDTDFFTPGASVGSKSILCVARLHDAQKRISDAVRALAMLGPEWSLELAGDGPDRAALQDLAAASGVAARIRFHGFVSGRDELRSLYRSARVFVLPSAYEGLPMVLLEAMSCGAAVVGSDIPPIAEVVDHDASGLLVPVREPSRLAEAIGAADRARDRLGAGAREAVVERHSRAAVGPQLAAALGRAARARAAHPARVALPTR